MSRSAETGRARAWPARADWPAWLLLGALGLLTLLLALKALQTVQTMLEFFNWPFQFDESESMIVAETLLLDHGVNIYGKLGPDQFIAAPYPPLYYLLNLPLVHFAGATFKGGRALSMLATAGAGAGIAAVAWRVTGDALAAALGGFAWGAIGIVGFWGALVKPDMLAVACGLAGLWWVLRTAETGGGRVWAALPLFWAAFYSKQTAIAAVVAAATWLVLRRWRTGLLFAAIYAAGAAGGYLVLNVLTTGGYFYHEFTIHDLPWMADRFLGRLVDWAGAYWLVIGAGLLGLAVLLARDGRALLGAAGGPSGVLRRLGRWETLAVPQGGVLLAGYLAASFLTASGAGTLGGNHNHLLDLTAACALGFAVAAAGLRAAAVTPVRVAGALLALGLCTQVPALYPTPHWLGHEFRLPSAARAEGMRNVAQYTSNTPGLVYATDLSLLLATDKWKLRLWTTDPYTQTHATLLHRWDESALVQAIRDHRFALVVLEYQLEDPQTFGAGTISPALAAAVRESYHLDQRNVEYIYKPNGP